eukprot:529699-Rhodomonas_salina.2
MPEPGVPPFQSVSLPSLAACHHEWQYSRLKRKLTCVSDIWRERKVTQPFAIPNPRLVKVRRVDPTVLHESEQPCLPARGIVVLHIDGHCCEHRARCF